VAFYPFDGAADDMAGIYRPSTLVNGPTLTTDRYSRSGYAYSFDGIDDYITISYAKGLGAWNNTTISGWINTAVEDKDMNIIQRTTADGHVGHTLSQISPGSDGNIYPAFNVLIHAPDPSHLAGGKIPVSSWTFFAVVIREGSATFYQDGAVVSWGNLWTKIVDSTQGTNLIIGGNSSYFNGKIDDIAIYNRELTVDEMDQLYRQTITKY
jgi:hypothetical protein